MYLVFVPLKKEVCCLEMKYTVICLAVTYFVIDGLHTHDNEDAGEVTQIVIE